MGEEFASKASTVDLYKKHDKVIEEMSGLKGEMSGLKGEIKLVKIQLKEASDLKGAIIELDKTLIRVQGSLEMLAETTRINTENLSNQIEEVKKHNGNQDDELTVQKERGKVDIIKFITDNWYKFGILFYLVKDLIIR